MLAKVNSLGPNSDRDLCLDRQGGRGVIRHGQVGLLLALERSNVLDEDVSVEINRP